jgi:protein-disulfide isomerase
VGCLPGVSWFIGGTVFCSRGSTLRFANWTEVIVAGLMLSLGSVAGAQTSLPPNQVSPFLDTSMLKPPAGVKVAIIEFEDLQCPDCAVAFPLIHEAMNRYKVPLVRYDFRIPRHMWSHEAALYARYLEDKGSVELATQYRRELYAAQAKISNNDDVDRFSKEFFAAHGKSFPAVLDPTGQLDREVIAGDAMGHRLSARMYTPTIIVVTPTAWIEVKDPEDLKAAIEQAEASKTSGAGATAGGH